MEQWPIDALQDVWELATKMHDGQKYGGQAQGVQIEYLNHIGSVVFEVMAALPHSPEMDANLALKCALLHDTLEDTALTLESIAAQCGEAVANGVLALTKDANIADKSEKMHDSLRRIKQQPAEVWAVKMADRICNLYAPPFYWNNAKKLAYMDEARLILLELQDGNAYLAERLAGKIKAYHRFLD